MQSSSQFEKGHECSRAVEEEAPAYTGSQTPAGEEVGRFNRLSPALLEAGRILPLAAAPCTGRCPRPAGWECGRPGPRTGPRRGLTTSAPVRRRQPWPMATSHAPLSSRPGPTLVIRASLSWPGPGAPPPSRAGGREAALWGGLSLANLGRVEAGRAGPQRVRLGDDEPDVLHCLLHSAAQVDLARDLSTHGFPDHLPA